MTDDDTLVDVAPSEVDAEETGALGGVVGADGSEDGVSVPLVGPLVL